MSKPEPTPLARALGRIPSGLFLVTVRTDDGPLGFLGSLVQQFAFDPPTIAVAVSKQRDHLQAIRRAGHFAINVLDKDAKHLMPPFFGKHDGDGPFDGLDVVDGANGAPLLRDAQAWMECEVSGEHDAGDHVAVFGRVTQGELHREGEPSVHLRRNGLSY